MIQRRVLYLVHDYQTQLRLSPIFLFLSFLFFSFLFCCWFLSWNKYQTLPIRWSYMCLKSVSCMFNFILKLFCQVFYYLQLPEIYIFWFFKCKYVLVFSSLFFSLTNLYAQACIVTAPRTRKCNISHKIFSVVTIWNLDDIHVQVHGFSSYTLHLTL
jgi:hypothetical protein